MPKDEKTLPQRLEDEGTSWSDTFHAAVAGFANRCTIAETLKVATRFADHAHGTSTTPPDPGSVR